jgi:molybdopterin adenylyltransferase
MSAAPRVAVLTISDRSFRGEREDRGGPAVVEAARRLFGAEVVEERIVPDEKDDIAWNLTRLADNVGVDLVLTTGGTGISDRDVTPEATRSVLSFEIPGLPEAMRAAGRAALPTAMLSRQVAGVRGKDARRQPPRVAARRRGVPRGGRRRAPSRRRDAPGRVPGRAPGPGPADLSPAEPQHCSR